MARSARYGERYRNGSPASLVPMPHGEALGLPVREKARVSPAVVADGQRAWAEVDDLHRVRMTALAVGRVIMVASVCRRGSARCYFGHLRSTRHLIHGQHLLNVRR